MPITFFPLFSLTHLSYSLPVLSFFIFLHCIHICLASGEFFSNGIWKDFSLSGLQYKIFYIKHQSIFLLLKVCIKLGNHSDFFFTLGENKSALDKEYLALSVPHAVILQHIPIGEAQTAQDTFDLFLFWVFTLSTLSLYYRLASLMMCVLTV